jgi:CubicO group peptidase (beta-lactamase class C family)
MHRHIASLLILGTLTSAVPADPTDTRIDRIFEDVDRPDSPGCAVVVVQDGEVVHRCGYGRAHLEWDAPIAPDTVFHVASVSKQFTALAVCLLAEDGKLSLDDNVRKHLPELPDWGRRITLRHLLQHTSGLHDATELLGYAGWRPGDLITNQDYLDFALRQKALDFKPGDRHVYCNTNYVLAGMVVQKVSGQTLRKFCNDRIFQPLGMTDTHFHDDHAEVVKKRASAYASRRDRLSVAVPQFDTVGSTGLFTTADDLVRWDRNFAKRKVGKRALDWMLEPGQLNSGEPIRHGRDLEYGLGLIIGRYRGLPIVSHSGSDRGYRSEFLRFPEHHLTVIILGNLETLQPYLRARRVADIVLAEHLPKPKVEASPSKPPTAEELAAWAGTYWNLRTGESWSFSAKDGKLHIGRRELTPVAADRFRIDELPFELIFSPGVDGSPRRLTWRDVDDQLFEAVPELDASKIRKEDYAGTYWSRELDTSIRLGVTGGDLSARGDRDEFGILRPVLVDAFSIRPKTLPAAFIRFLRGERNEVTGFTVSTERCSSVLFEREGRERNR